MQRAARAQQHVIGGALAVHPVEQRGDQAVIVDRAAEVERPAAGGLAVAAGLEVEQEVAIGAPVAPGLEGRQPEEGDQDPVIRRAVPDPDHPAVVVLLLVGAVDVVGGEVAAVHSQPERLHRVGQPPVVLRQALRRVAEIPPGEIAPEGAEPAASRRAGRAVEAGEQAVPRHGAERRAVRRDAGGIRARGGSIVERIGPGPPRHQAAPRQLVAGERRGGRQPEQLIEWRGGISMRTDRAGSRHLCERQHQLGVPHARVPRFFEGRHHLGGHRLGVPQAGRRVHHQRQRRQVSRLHRQRLTRGAERLREGAVPHPRAEIGAVRRQPLGPAALGECHAVPRHRPPGAQVRRGGEVSRRAPEAPAIPRVPQPEPGEAAAQPAHGGQGAVRPFRLLGLHHAPEGGGVADRLQPGAVPVEFHPRVGPLRREGCGETEPGEQPTPG